MTVCSGPFPTIIRFPAGSNARTGPVANIESSAKAVTTALATFMAPLRDGGVKRDGPI
jgi:hypothetical protein